MKVKCPKKIHVYLIFEQKIEKLKPVMLWIHGGGFDSGTSAWDPGMALAKKRRNICKL